LNYDINELLINDTIVESYNKCFNLCLSLFLLRLRPRDIFCIRHVALHP